MDQSDSGKIYLSSGGGGGLSAPKTIVSEKSHREDVDYEASIEQVENVDHVPEGTASEGKALFMLLKAFVGTGVVFLPGS